MPMVQSKRLLLRLWHGGLKRFVIFGILGPLICGIELSALEICLDGSPSIRGAFEVAFFTVPPLLLSAGLDALLSRSRPPIRFFLVVSLGYFADVAFMTFLTWEVFPHLKGRFFEIANVVFLIGDFIIIPLAVSSLLSSGTSNGKAEQAGPA